MTTVVTERTTTATTRTTTAPSRADERVVEPRCIVAGVVRRTPVLASTGVEKSFRTGVWPWRRQLYAALGFERYADTRADRLSCGTLSKLNLGLALPADPEVLLLLRRFLVEAARQPVTMTMFGRGAGRLRHRVG